MNDPSFINSSFLDVEEDPSLSPKGVLNQVFGYPDFRGLQAQAINSVMQGKDVLLLMPTGGGKSICYQIPALCRPGMGLVISPLIALMDDQVATLRQLGINAGALHSELENQEASSIRRDIINGKLDLLYISPERLTSESMFQFLKDKALSVIAIDEAHCVSVWGHEFRPEYRSLAILPKYFPHAPRIALTATADLTTQQDIVNALAMSEGEVLKASFHRPNLYIRVFPKAGELRQLQLLLKKHIDEAIIIYCGSRQKAERIAASLNKQGGNALPYHAGLAAIEKRAALLRFRSGEPIIIVATIAFGMGIDRPDVRLVVHLDMPSSPESYYQQIGRAGRDGDPAEAVLFYGGEDIVRARYWLDQSAAPSEQKQIARQRLEAMVAFVETVECRTQVLLRCFEEDFPKPCGHCDNCSHPVSLFNGTVAAQKVLSAVYRTGQRFGALHVINVLRGKKNEAVERHCHDRLSLFGIGKDKSDRFWKTIIRHLMAQDALRQGVEYSNLFLNQDVARSLLRGEKIFYLREDLPEIEEKNHHKLRENKENFLLSGDEQKRFDNLKQWRLVEAREQEVPPYIIFHDAVLREIAITQPADLEALSLIKGIGTSKLERYGQAVIDNLYESKNSR